VRKSPQESPQTSCIEWPAQFRAITFIAQDRNPRAVARFQPGIAVDKHAGELGRMNPGEQRQRLVAQMAVIALEQG